MHGLWPQIAERPESQSRNAFQQSRCEPKGCARTRGDEETKCSLEAEGATEGERRRGRKRCGPDGMGARWAQAWDERALHWQRARVRGCRQGQTTVCGQQQTTLFQSITGQPPVVFIHSLSSFHSPERTKTKHPTLCIQPTAPGLTRHAALDTYLCWPAYLSFHCMPIASSSSSSSSCSNYFRAFFGLACLHSHSQHPSFTTTCSWLPHSPIFRPFWPLPHAHSCTKKTPCTTFAPPRRALTHAMYPPPPARLPTRPLLSSNGTATWRHVSTTTNTTPISVQS
ncbi:hypothetical protein IWZ00DRAFT_273221 [Phyllosticta capitalensis]|uniref:Uncharacterized protein n=1 Tax=Phyllosticta capitalensis TaxID=121624 RepID=A0ABR1YPV1_9PEZI